eukprot:scaffold19175_cov102-Isochrysis_galbana.AAC.2
MWGQLAPTIHHTTHTPTSWLVATVARRWTFFSRVRARAPDWHTPAHVNSDVSGPHISTTDATAPVKCARRPSPARHPPHSIAKLQECL